jgi:ATP-dependent Zn protease
MEKRPPFLDMAASSRVEYSQSTAELIDSEIKKIIEKQYERAFDILRGKEESLKSASRVLPAHLQW